MSAEIFWKMEPEQFNSWRKHNDYPRLFKVFREKLPHFDTWLSNEGLNAEIIFDNGFARFLGTDEPLILCEYEGGDLYLFDESLEQLPSIRKAGWILSERKYSPYFYWLRRHYGEEKYSAAEREFRISSWRGGIPYFYELPLLQLGNIKLNQAIISGRHLDFCCLDGLQMVDCHSNQHTYVWYSSAIGLTFYGGSAFWSFNKTSCWMHGNVGYRKEMLLTDGIFQDFHFKDSDPHLHLVRSKLNMSSVSGVDFECILEYSSFDSVAFDAGENGCASHLAKAKFFGKIKSLYSSTANSVDAGRYFYEEQKCLLLAQLHPSVTYRSKWFKSSPLKKAKILTQSYFRLLLYVTSFIAWGFGERPARSLFASIALIAVSALLYYFFPGSVTVNDMWSSLYFSIVTFVTLGYGDIYQKVTPLRIYSSLEAFGGMFLIGLFLAGYASKSKQY
ncbi:potassium channel family protein [Pseudomonas pharyngis]|uniref:potassium channel family protein n=1 Tax=Pseudomonas pharyngis TaxID=2892333 RepID=UPI001F3B36F4|nr:potassium channel family protein [Pseudomonas pharyngis]